MNIAGLQQVGQLALVTALPDENRDIRGVEPSQTRAGSQVQTAEGCSKRGQQVVKDDLLILCWSDRCSVRGLTRVTAYTLQFQNVFHATVALFHYLFVYWTFSTLFQPFN